MHQKKHAELHSWKPAQQGNAGKQLADDDDEGSYQGRRGNTMRYMPHFRTLPALSAACQKRGGIVAFFDEALRGVGQVFFCNSPISGFLMLAGVFASDALVGAFCVFGVCLATWFARILNLDKNLLASGIWGYNGALVGCAFAAFTLPPVYNSGASASPCCIKCRDRGDGYVSCFSAHNICTSIFVRPQRCNTVDFAVSACDLAIFSRSVVLCARRNSVCSIPYTTHKCLCPRCSDAIFSTGI